MADHEPAWSEWQWNATTASYYQCRFNAYGQPEYRDSNLQPILQQSNVQLGGQGTNQQGEYSQPNNLPGAYSQANCQRGTNSQVNYQQGSYPLENYQQDGHLQEGYWQEAQQRGFRQQTP